MPIITLQLIVHHSDSKLSRDSIQTLASRLGQLFDCAPATLWLRVEYLGRDQYAENDTQLAEGVAPTFVEVLLADETEPELRQLQAERIAQEVSAVLARPIENTHVIFAPAARGRIAFGGRLLC